MNKILMIPSFSMRSYTRDVWLLSRDAHFTQAQAMCKYMHDVFDIDMLVPKKHDLDLLDPRTATFRPIMDPNYRQNVLEQRASRDWLAALDPEEDYEFIFTGHPEYAATLRHYYPRATIGSVLTHGPLITSAYLKEIGDGIEASDFVFHNFSTSILPAQFVHRLDVARKLKPLYAYADYSVREAKFPEKEPGSILFLSRMTDKSRFDLDFWTRQLVRLAKKHRVTLTNPSEGSLPDLPGVEIRIQESKEEYFETLRRSETVIIPYSIERTYSVSYFEALAKGCKMITLKCHDHFRHMNAKYSLNGDVTEKALDAALAEPYDYQPFVYADRHYIGKRWCLNFKIAYIH